MTSTHTVHPQSCGHCRVAIPAGRLFCPGCGKPARQAAQTSYRPFSTGSVSSASIACAPVAHWTLPAAPAPAKAARMSWEWLLLWSLLTFGVSAAVAAFQQVLWARRMGAGGQALRYLVLAMVFLVPADLMFWTAFWVHQAIILLLPVFPLTLAGMTCWLLCAWSLTEAMGKVSDCLMTRFRPNRPLGLLCGVFYFQHCVVEIEREAGLNPAP